MKNLEFNINVTLNSDGYYHLYINDTYVDFWYGNGHLNHMSVSFLNAIIGIDLTQQQLQQYLIKNYMNVDSKIKKN